MPKTTQVTPNGLDSRVGRGADRSDRAADLRATLVGSQIVGVVMARYVVAVEPLASLDPERLIAALGPNLQRYLVGRSATRLRRAERVAAVHAIVGRSAARVWRGLCGGPKGTAVQSGHECDALEAFRARRRTPR